MPAAKKKPATKKEAAAAKKTAPTAVPAASPAGPDPVVVLGYQLGNVLVFWMASPHFIVAGPCSALCTFRLVLFYERLFRTFVSHFPSSFFPPSQIPECKTAEVKALQIDKDRLQAEVQGLQTQLKEEQSWHEAIMRDITRQHKSRPEK